MVAVGALIVVVPAARTRLAGAGRVLGISPAVTGNARIAMQAPPPPPTLLAGPVTAPADLSLFGWALLDLRTGTMSGSANRETVLNTTESMVKVWLAADYLRRLGSQRPTQQTLSEIALMIEDSNDLMADKYYNLDGGPAAIQRLSTVCKLTHTVPGQSWSYTRMTPADAARYGRCVEDSTAAGPTWTGWLLDTMRHVRGTVQDQTSETRQGGRWGIIDGLPASMVPATAIKNGWTYIYADARWHIDCLAIQRDWVLTVEMQFAGSQTSAGLQRGADVCASVARQLVYAPAV
ncbi:hypothetical protein Raf01_35940 [Rugosimonospora africana]|uniref:Uncharacterized protein n=2 Tax=Rugosimonospora africana TaxID=556532 RepID=A0A8J3QSH2_9ACTN|nr:hypothetical protein Raf01_35940 [Rugosimonospora africana]